jgi:RNA polymerase sigma-70 factor (ECF subfamily)
MEDEPVVPDASCEAGQTSLTLLTRLRENEAEAWSVMVQLYTPLVRQWAARAGLQGADLDDLTQEVFRAAVTGLAQFRRDRPGDSFRGWLYGISRHVLLRHFKRSARTPEAEGGTDAQMRLEELPSPDSEPGESEPPDERHALLRRALELVRNHFEEKTWEAFWLTVIDGRAAEDVAARLGISPAAVRKYKSRVLQRLRVDFGELID